MTILAYLTLILTPFLGGIFMIICIIPLSIFQFIGLDKVKLSYLSALVGSFLLLWCYVLFFEWLGVQISFWIYIIMIALTIFNNIRRIKTRPNPTYEKTILIMELIGYTMSATIFIFT
jgi:hypothetical protein